MKVALNDNFVKEFTDLNSGDFGNKVGSCSVEVTLKKGFNTVKLFNPETWMPNIDCMEVAKAI